MFRIRQGLALWFLLAVAGPLPAPAAPPPPALPTAPPPASGIDRLALAQKLTRALRYSLRSMAPAVAAQIQPLVTPAALVPLVAVLVGGVVAQEVPVIGEVVDVGLVAFAAYALGWEGVLAASDFVRFAKGAALAESEADLERAGQHFARFVARVGVDVAVAVLAHKVAKRLKTEVRERSGGGLGGGDPGDAGGALAPAPAAAASASPAAPRYRVHADGSIVALGPAAAGAGWLRREGEEDPHQAPAAQATAGAGGGAAEAASIEGAGALGSGAPPPAPAGMSPALLALRQTLHDPRAIASFDKMFDRMGRNSAFMEDKLALMRQGLREGESFEQQMLREGRKHKPPEGAPLPPELLAEIDAELARGPGIARAIERYAEAHPEVQGIAEWRTRLDGSVNKLREFKASPLEKVTPGSIQAVRGPLTGLEAAIETAWETERVVAVEREFWYKLPEPPGRKRANVDVVADDGATWIESKAEKPFGLGSSDWASCKKQALSQLEAARQNLIQGRPPRVVFRFTRGVSRAVAAELEALGIEVRGTRMF